MNRIIKYGIIIGGMLFLILIPERLIFQNQISVCIFKHLTGIECPLCGMTRACFNIMHLHLSTAFWYNPVSLMLPIMLVSEAVYDIFPSVHSEKYRRAVIILFLACLAVLFIVRIIHSFLAG